MSESVMVALLSLTGTLVGSFAGIMAANRLINYRLQKLEEKVEKHNNVVDRTYHIETRLEVMENAIKHYHGGEL